MRIHRNLRYVLILSMCIWGVMFWGDSVYAMEHIIQEEQMEVLSDNELSAWGDFRYSVLEDGTCEVYYWPTGTREITELTYPAEIEGKKVTAIMSCYLSNYEEDKKKIIKVNIPDSVNFIDSFIEFDNLESVSLYGSAEKMQPVILGDYAFPGYLPLKNVDERLFSNVAVIGKNALTSKCFEHLSIYGNRIEIKQYAFGESLKDLSIKANELTIQEDAFEYCDGLESLCLEGVTHLEGDMFGDLSHDKERFPMLTSLSLSGEGFNMPSGGFAIFPNLEQVRLIGAVSIKNGAFKNCDKLEEVQIGEGLCVIEDNAFYKCNSLKEIALPNSVENIESYAFNECTNLEKVTTFGSEFEQKAENSIDDQCFAGCVKLECLEIPKSITKIGAVFGYYEESYSLQEVLLHDGFLEIGANAFKNCVALETVAIPNSVHTIGENAFRNCYSLFKVETFGEQISEEGVGVKDYAFQGCSNLKEITYPKSISKVGSYNNASCGEEVVIPENIKEIGTLSITGKVKSIVLQEGVTKINGLLDVYEYSFGAKVRRISIPSTVDTIEINKINCNSLEIIEVEPNHPNYTTQDGVLFNKDKTELLFYPPSKKDIYYEIPESVVTIGEYAFKNNQYLEKIKWPAGLQTIKNGAFYGGQLEIDDNGFPDSVQTVGASVYAETYEYGSDIIIPEKVKRVGDKVLDFWFLYHSPNVYFYNKDCIIEGRLDESTELYGGINDEGNYKGWTIYGYSVSTAYDYAKQYGLRFCDIETGQQLLPTVEPLPNPFADVKDTGWEYPFVKFAVENELMKGKGTTDDGKIIFDPSNNMTRAEFVQTLYNKEGKPAVSYQSTFTDVPDGQWYTSAIMWASQNGIVAGKGDKFDVSGNITRQEMATILCKYATNYKKYDAAGRADVSGYTDVSTISSWATENMKWAVQYGIMKGKGDKLAPQANASRAECATMLKNFMDAYE